MTEAGAPDPLYIPRHEEQQILDVAGLVGSDRQSRAVLLYGPGGVGKTSLVRQLALEHKRDPRTAWVPTVDIDDSEYWLLSNLELHVAAAIDPGHHYFGPYLEHLSRLPVYTRRRIGYETVVSHLAQVKRVFADCYRQFVEGTGKSVVITIDTVEVVRGTYLLHTLTQWMKNLPATLFILAGRPPRGPEGPEAYSIADPIQFELEDPHQPLPVTSVRLGEFTETSALSYLAGSVVADGLSAEAKEKEKLVRLTRGHPLWLAFTVDYLQHIGLPAEASEEFSDIAEQVPYEGELPPAGQSLHDEFIRHLVAPYNETDFWHETLKRLAVTRESMSKEVWERLMADRPLPDGVESLDAAWDQLLTIPWIRPRANHRYVTLHDALAEELAQRIIPVHDQGKQWRDQQWRRAREIYAELSDAGEAAFASELAGFDDELHAWSPRLVADAEQRPAEEERRLIEDASALEARRRELSQFAATRLCYELLCDFKAGCERFLELMEQAKADHDILFQDLLAAEIQRFLPGDVDAHASGDVVGQVIDEFRAWLGTSRGSKFHLDIGRSLADYLIRTEQPEPALKLLDNLPEQSAIRRQRFRLSNLRGNACMRIPGRVRDAEDYFKNSLSEARRLPTPERARGVAMANKELGFYYRNVGRWRDADNAYARARDVISATLLVGGSDDDREEMASIHSNWAYVKGLTGDYRAGTNLAMSAVNVRHRLGNLQDEGTSWSVLGEVYRYERRYQKAWEAYGEAERIFEELRNWAWLGLVYQEQAICLFQAVKEGIEPVPNAVAEARRLVTTSLDLCRDLAVRGYPSALNRAGRIFAENSNDGLKYLADGIDEGRRLSDGWFWFANLVERAELCYRAWLDTEDQDYLDQIGAHTGDIDSAIAEYDFPDLVGRWDLLQGHVLVRRWQATHDPGDLGDALEHYKNGVALIAQDFVGSSGAAAVADEFRNLAELIKPLPPQIKAEWQAALRRAWSGLRSRSGSGSAVTLLLAGLEELY
jgi:tetratricopeptide (TPR) repeat protein